MGIFKSLSFRVPIISVGNISTGGSGKTPLVMHLAQEILKMGKIPGIVSRGYGRISKGLVMVYDGSKLLTDVESAGDEPYLMASVLKRVPIAVCENRSNAVEHLISSYQIDIIIMDDGFQHRKVKRDVDILTLSANDQTADHHLLPWGKLREPIKNLHRANRVVVTKTDNFTPPQILSLLNPFFKNDPIFSIENFTLIKYAEDGYNKSLPIDKEVFAFCGIGEPDSFFKALSQLHIRLGGKRIFRDHQPYSLTVINELSAQIKSTGCAVIITTEKDLVKLPDSFLDMFEVYMVKLEVEFEDNEVLQELVLPFIN